MKDFNINDKEWEEELKDAVTLRNLTQESSFNAPGDYFDSLPSNIMEKIAASERNAVVRPLFSLRNLLIPSLAVAAVVLALFIFGKGNHKESKLVAMNYDDIYNTGLVSDLDENLLMDALSEEASTTTSSGTTDMENYLIEASTDEALINAL